MNLHALTPAERKPVEVINAARKRARDKGGWDAANRTVAVAAKEEIRGKLMPALRKEGALDPQKGTINNRRLRYNTLRYAYGPPLRQHVTPEEVDEGSKYPPKLPKRYEWHWDHPWTLRARRHKNFRKWLDSNGYLTPHFSKEEARCKDGTSIEAVNRAARDHAFNLEILRHALGDVPIAVISWYRTPSWNRRVRGARNSKHIFGIATDHPREWVEHVGRSKVLKVGNVVFIRGGMGVYPGGSMHFDSRGVWARWSSF